MIDTNSLETNNHQLSYQSNTAQIGATSAYGLSNSRGGGSFIGNLPVGYQAFSGTLIRTDDFTTAVEGGIYGAPPPETASGDAVSFGNPNTRYAWAYTPEPGIGYDYRPQESSFQIPPSFQLDGDDALVLFGQTPASISYMSLNLYNTLRPRSDGAEGGVDGYSYSGSSIGLGLNQTNLRTTKDNGEAPFNNQFALIVTSNITTRDRIQASLISTGIPGTIINSYLFPENFADVGKTEKPNQLSFLLRYTFQTESERQIIDQYMENIPAIRNPVDFDEYTLQSYGSEDRYSQVVLGDEGRTFQISGNTWKRINNSYKITPNTVLEFDFKSDRRGEVHGIGFDNDNNISNDRFFKLYGSEARGISAFNNYNGSGQWQHYVVPVGQFFTGDMNALTFINDNDVLRSTSNSLFSNIKIYENVANPVINVAFVKGPRQNGDVTTIPNWTETLRDNPVELSLGSNLDTLQQSVLNTYAQQGYTLKQALNEEIRHVDSDVTRATDQFGAYDSPDANYTSFRGGQEDPLLGSIIRFESDDDILIMIGADHTITGDNTNATYWSYESKAVGPSTPKTFSFTNYYTTNSAAQFVSPEVAQDLFAVKIARSSIFGGGQPYMVNIPVDSGTTSLQNQFSIVGRVYLDKITGSGPNPANLLPSRILWLTKSSNHVAQTQQINTVTPATIADLALEYKDTGKLLREKESPNHVSSGVVLNYGSIAIRNNIKPLTDKTKGYDELTNSKAQTSPFKVIDDLLGTTDDTPLFSLESPPSIIDPLSLPL